MDVPNFLLRKLYKRGSLRETEYGFAFIMQNQLATATILTPPRIVVNGIAYDPAHVRADFDLLAVPFSFERGSKWELEFQGFLLKGGNRIHFEAETKEFGHLEFLVEDSKRDLDEEE